jgi:hypothetical protein
LSSNTLSLCTSLNVRDHVPHTYRTTGKIIVFLSLLPFSFLNSYCWVSNLIFKLPTMTTLKSLHKTFMIII